MKVMIADIQCEKITRKLGLKWQNYLNSGNYLKTFITEFTTIKKLSNIMKVIYTYVKGGFCFQLGRPDM